MSKELSSLFAPTTGKIVDLKSIDDPVFSSKSMGEGIGFKSANGTIVSPVDGEITVANDVTKYAYGIKTENDIEVLIHVGIDTVNLKGKGFTSFVKQGQKVKKGETLVKVNLNLLKEKNYDPTVIMVITNTTSFHNIRILQNNGEIQAGQKIITLEKKKSLKSGKEASKSKKKQLAVDILKNIVGEQNIAGFTHCATRLRFNLKDNSKADLKKLKNLDVIQVIEAGGQLQIVIGTEVGSLYEEIRKIMTFDPDNSNTPSTNTKGKISTKIFDIISGSFTPLIPVICGSGLIKALVTILVSLKLITPKSGTFAILSAAGNAVFYFMPILLGVTTAKKLKASPYIGATIGAALLEPNFTNLLKHGTGSLTNFAGIPVVLQSYSSTVIPIFLAMFVFAFLEKLLKKIIPDKLHLAFVPFLSLLIMVPLTLIAFGPFGVYVARLIASAIKWLLGTSSILTGFILAACWIPLVVFGLHWAITPIMISNIATTGSDPLMGLIIGTVWCAGGAALGVFLKTKDTKLKEIAGTSLIPAFLSGVTEPIIYGILFKHKRIFGITILMGAITGALVGWLNLRATQIAGGLFTIPTFITVGSYLIVIAVSIIGTALLTYFFGFKSEKVKKDVAK